MGKIDEGRLVCIGLNCFMIFLGLIGVIGSAIQAPEYTPGWVFLTFIFIVFAYAWDGIMKDA